MDSQELCLLPPSWWEGWVRGEPGDAIPAETPEPRVPKSMEWQRSRWVLAEESGRLVWAITRSLCFYPQRVVNHCLFNQINNEFMEDNFGSMHGMNCWNQRETLRVEKAIQITLAFR